MMQDVNTLALFGVIGVAMTTSATLLVRTVIATLRQPRVPRDAHIACSCC